MCRKGSLRGGTVFHGHPHGEKRVVTTPAAWRTEEALHPRTEFIKSPLNFYCQAHAEIEGEKLFFCIVIDNRNPHLKAIITDFEKNAALLTENKP